MKHFLSILLAATLMACLALAAGCAAKTPVHPGGERDLSRFVTNLFSAVDQVKSFQVPEGLAINDGVSEYIAGKIEERKIAYEATGSELQDYGIQVTLTGAEELGTDLKARRFSVTVSFHYKNLESVDSGYGREIELLYRTDQEGGVTVVGVRVLGILDGYDAYLYEDLDREGAMELTDAQWVRDRASQYISDAAASAGK